MKYIITLILITVCSFAYTQTDSLKVVDIPLGEVTKKDVSEQLNAMRIAQENLSRIITYIQEAQGLDSLVFIGFTPDLKARFREPEKKLTK